MTLYSKEYCYSISLFFLLCPLKLTMPYIRYSFRIRNHATIRERHVDHTHFRRILIGSIICRLISIRNRFSSNPNMISYVRAKNVRVGVIDVCEPHTHTETQTLHLQKCEIVFNANRLFIFYGTLNLQCRLCFHQGFLINTPHFSFPHKKSIICSGHCHSKLYIV